MRHLLLVKHSLPQVMPEVPAKLWPLSEEGRSRCLKLAEEIVSYHPQVIVASLEPKAVETAVILSSSLRIPLKTAEGLHEHQRVDFLSKEAFEASIAAFFAHPDELVFGQETALHALERFTGALEGALISHVDENVIIVAHGTVITLFVAHHTRLSPFPLWQKLGLPSCVVLSMQPYHMIEIIGQVSTN